MQQNEIKMLWSTKLPSVASRQLLNNCDRNQLLQST